MKTYFENRINKLTEQRNALTQGVENKTAEQLQADIRAISEIDKEIAECRKQIEAIDGAWDKTPESRGGNLVSLMNNKVEKRDEETPFASLEYRKAFMEFVQHRGEEAEKILKRAGGDTGTTVTSELGAIIPVNIMNEFVKEVSKNYGRIYSKVRKLSVKGGVKFPVSKLTASFKWIAEGAASDKQKAGEAKEFIEFSYNIGEVRIATSLLAEITTLAVFESEIVKIMVEAYVEAMDKAIISGTGVNSPLGITKDSRVKNVVTLTDEEFGDWTAWRKKLFAKIPLSKRGKGEFLFTAATVESNLFTMKDQNDRPLFKDATDLSVSNSDGKFFGREVTLVEPDVIADLDTATAGDIVGIYWVPSDYLLNTNMEFGMKKYFDEDANEWVNKGLTIVDGKILDPSGCYLIKKG